MVRWLRDAVSNPYIGAGTSATLRRVGLYHAGSSTGVIGALLINPTAIGTNTTQIITAEGPVQQYATGATIDANAGLRFTQKSFRREFGSYMILRIVPSTTSNIRCFVGWSSDTADIAGETTLNNFSGVGVGKRVADTNWFTYRNDADATEDRVDTTIAFAASGVTIELELDSTSFRSKIGGVTQTAQTTELPLAATSLTPHIEIETSDAVDKNIQIGPIWAKTGPEVMI